MVLDNITLSGLHSYLKDNNDVIDLVTSISNKGTSPVLGQGIVLDVSGISLLFESDDFYSLFARRNAPIIDIEVMKEIVPGLFKDPYRHRVHLVGGNDDFNRGVFTNCKLQDVEGYTTIVSMGTDSCKWESEIYVFDQMKNFPLLLNAASWDLCSPKLTPDDGFNYSIMLETWKPADNILSAPTGRIKLADNLFPRDNRFNDLIQDKAKNIFAYRLVFSAKVNHDSYMKERYVGKLETQNVGRPLLRSINLFEPSEPVFSFYSLHELIANSPAYQFYEEHNANPKRLSAALALTAALEENESITIQLDPNVFNYAEARLNARVRVRPPVIDK